jgi:D-glycerate 3-kinase
MKEVLGRGMTDDQVEKFVDGYMPAYEMYIDGLMNGELFSGKSGKRILRFDYDLNRKIVGVQEGEVVDKVIWKDLKMDNV